MSLSKIVPLLLLAVVGIAAAPEPMSLSRTGTVVADSYSVSRDSLFGSQTSAPMKRSLTPLAQCVTGYHAQFVAQSPWLNLAPGQEADAWGEWRNTGYETWSSGLFIGTWGPTPGQDQASILGGGSGCPAVTNWASCTRIAPSYQPVAYGQTVRFNFRIRAPVARGAYWLYVRPLIEGVTWMEDEGVHWQVNTRLYRRADAAAYADTWALGRNNQYPSFPNDCQNFVSQAMLAGGLPQQGTRYGACYYTEWHRPIQCSVEEGCTWRWTHSWTVAQCQYDYFAYYSDYFSLVFWSQADMWAGDVLHMDIDGVAYPTHSRIFVGAGYDSETNVWYTSLYDQHTTDRRRIGWDRYTLLDFRLWKWHVTY